MINLEKLVERLSFISEKEKINLTKFKFDFLQQFINEHSQHGGFYISLGYDFDDNLSFVYLNCNFVSNPNDISLCLRGGKYNKLQVYPNYDIVRKIKKLYGLKDE